MINLHIDKISPTPFYRQIIDQVLAGISSGRIKPGDRLPTIRDLAVRMEVNPNTVVKAYTQLEMMGVLDTQQGSGNYVRPSDVQVGPEQRQQAAKALCLDFVGRAQMLNISIDDLIACLGNLKRGVR